MTSNQAVSVWHANHTDCWLPVHLQKKVTPAEGNYVYALNEGNFKTFLPNSLFYAATAVTGILVVSSMAGYVLARIETPGHNAVLLLILAILIIPAPASFIALYKLLVNMHLANTALAISWC